MMDSFHSFSSAPVGDEMREIARMLGTEQKAVSTSTVSLTRTSEADMRPSFPPRRYR